MAHNERHTARQDRRAARRAARQGRGDSRREARTQRQAQRQGFLSGIVGDEGLGGIVSQFTGGSDDFTKEGGTGTGDDKDNTMMYLLVGLGAYMLMNKKK